MNYWAKITPALLLAALAGCVTIPAGPSVNVLPAQGKPFEKFMAEDATCRQWAEQRLGGPTREVQDKNLATGAVAGTAIGAGLGAAVGSASGHAGAGAAIGAAGGLLFGGAAGAASAEGYGYEAQRRYDNAYLQCMYTYGNQIPGERKVAVAAAPAPPRMAAPPPPPVAVPAPPREVVVVPPPPPVVAPPPPPVVVVEPEYLPPPEVYLQEPPEFVYSPSLNMYVAVGLPYDLFYTGNEYLYYYRGNWYRGPYYDGPWSYLPRRSYPPSFARYRIDNIRRFREMEYRRYQRDRLHYEGRLHRPAYRERWTERMEHRR